MPGILETQDVEPFHFACAFPGKKCAIRLPKSTVAEFYSPFAADMKTTCGTAARLLANGILNSKALLTKLQNEKAELDVQDKIGTTKDGKNKKVTDIKILKRGSAKKKWRHYLYSRAQMQINSCL